MHDNLRYNQRHNGAYALFAIMSSLGAVIAAFRDSLSSCGPIILLAALPLAWYIMWIVGLNRSLITHTLFRGKYFEYALTIFLLCYSIPLFGIVVEWGVRQYLGLDHVIHNYLSPWILLDALSTTVLLMVIMFGMAIEEMYVRWRRESRVEKKVSVRLANNLEQFRRRLSPNQLLQLLDDVIISCRRTPEDVFAKIQSLSQELRMRLYDADFQIKTSRIAIHPITRIEAFMSRKRYRSLRLVFLQVFIAIISVTAFFTAPDAPDFSTDGMIAFVGMFVIFNLLIFGNIYLTRRFLRNGRLIDYFVRGGVFILAMVVVLTVTQLVTYHAGVLGSGLSPWYSILSTLASMATISLVLAGVSAFIALQKWLEQRRRIIKLDAETKSIELTMLQSQINPHFLFNVLNNIAVLVEESPKDAEAMLIELRSLLEYQLLNFDCRTTTLAEERDFLKCFLSLEKSRKDPFDFSIEMPHDISEVAIPTLLLIPFVENAAKHSTVINDRRYIEIEMKVENHHFIFICRNTFNPLKVSTKNDVGGLGIDNTLRRLRLIYDDDFTFKQTIKDNDFEIFMKIPLTI